MMKWQPCSNLFSVLKITLPFVVVSSWPQTFAAAAKSIEKAIAVCSMEHGKPLIQIRKVRSEKQVMVLAVDPSSLETTLYPASDVSCHRETWEDLNKKFGNTPYLRIRESAKNNSKKFYDAGVTRLFPEKGQLYLTIDLCPSKRPLDRAIFYPLLDKKRFPEPVPVAIAITGKWMKKHQKDLRWLIQLQKNNRIKITWVNHTYHHYYKKRLPLRKNFLLASGTKLSDEILLTEKLMIDSGLVPSVFFRFPGLVSNEKLFHEILQYGLIPIGSDAWLAKKEKPREGSIILLHGNGNEPAGVRIFLKTLREQQGKHSERQWVFHDMRRIIEENSQQKNLFLNQPNPRTKRMK